MPMKCIECLYFYREEGEAREACHYEYSPFALPPCEQEDADRLREIEEIEYQSELDKLVKK